MIEEPDLDLEIDILFDHLINELDHELEDELDWVFSLRSEDVQKLIDIGEEVGDEFVLELQEHVEDIDEDDNVSIGEPMLSLVQRGAFDQDQVKSLAARIGAIAAAHEVVLEGVDCQYPMDEEEFLSWIEPEDAYWRLRVFTDSGLEENAELPWTFLVVTDDARLLPKLAGKLQEIGFGDVDIDEEPDEDGSTAICVFVAGRNNEAELIKASETIASCAEQNGGQLVGIQFYSREDLAVVFADEDDDESDA